MASDSQDLLPEEINLKYEDTLELTTDDECTGQRARRRAIMKIDEVDTNVQKIISKNKSESMYELRKLNHQQHPVSGFSKKDTFEDFLSSRQSSSILNQATSESQNSASTVAAAAEAKVCDLSSPLPNHDTLQQDAQTSGLEEEVAQSSSAAAQTSEGLNVSQRVQQFNPPAEAAATQSFMPSNIRLDMQSLLERQIVHEVLQGPAEEIDRVLREGMEERNARRRPRPRPRPRPQVSREEDGDDAGDEMGSGNNSRPVGRLLSRGTHRGRSRNRRVQFAPSIPTPDASGRYPIPRRDQSVIVERLRQSPALNSLGDEARDEIVAEVSGLVSRQLVTSALSGEFRGVLELHIQSRAQQANGGQPRPSFIVPPRRHDSDEDSNDREQMPSAQVHELREEMMSIRGQLNELKQMMKLSFDLQLDIQRSIRQEVAAALSNALSQRNTHNEDRRTPLYHYGSMGGANGARNSQVVDSGRCVICSEGVIDSVIYHCGHMATCIACGLEMKSKALKCPICRAPITDVIRAYTSML